MSDAVDADEFGDVLRRFLETRVDLPSDGPDDIVTTHDPKLWHELAVDLGVAGLLVPERLGGAAAPLAVGARACSEAGRSLLGEPIAPTLLASTMLSAAPASDGVDETLSAIAAGSAVAVAGADRDRRPSSVAASPPEGARCRLTGISRFVVSLQDSEFVVVEARTDTGPVIACAPTSAVGVFGRDSIDRTRSIGDAIFDDTDAVVVAAGESAAEVATRGFAVGALWTALDAIGGADRIFAMTLDYIRDRYQFGRAVGSFQAVKHRCAETAVDLELAHATVDDAVAAISTGRADWHAAIATATLFAKEAYLGATHDAVLSLGGIGFTWEHAAHRFYRRAQLNRSLFGEPTWWAQQLASDYEDVDDSVLKTAS